MYQSHQESAGNGKVCAGMESRETDVESCGEVFEICEGKWIMRFLCLVFGADELMTRTD